MSRTLHRTLTRTLATVALAAAVVPFAGAHEARADFQPIIDLPPIPLTPLYFCDGRIADVVGTSGDDMLFGTEGNDVIVALGGNDQVFGLGGRDTICTGAGDDWVDAGAGRDFVDGQSGHDLVSHMGDPAGISANLMYGRIIAAEGTDTVARVEDVLGTDFADRLVGDYHDNLLVGGFGHDVIDGRNGQDVCLGEVESRCELDLD